MTNIHYLVDLLSTTEFPLADNSFNLGVEPRSGRRHYLAPNETFYMKIQFYFSFLYHFIKLLIFLIDNEMK